MRRVDWIRWRCKCPIRRGDGGLVSAGINGRRSGALVRIIFLVALSGLVLVGCDARQDDMVGATMNEPRAAPTAAIPAATPTREIPEATPTATLPPKPMLSQAVDKSEDSDLAKDEARLSRTLPVAVQTDDSRQDMSASGQDESGSVADAGSGADEESYPCSPSSAQYHRINFATIGIGGVHFLDWTPDGRHLVFPFYEFMLPSSPDSPGRVVREPMNPSIYRVDVLGSRVDRVVVSNPRDLFSDGFYADVSPDGTHIVYSSCQFDADGLVPANGPVSNMRYQIAIVGMDGAGVSRLTMTKGHDNWPVWSPDGTRVAFLTVGLESLVSYGGLRIIPTDDDIEEEAVMWIDYIAPYAPVWSPDGKRLAFLVREAAESNRGWRGGIYADTWVLYTVAPDGSDLRRISETHSGVSWSPDGQRIVLARIHDDDIALISIAPDGSEPQLSARLDEQEVIAARRNKNLRNEEIRTPDPWIDLVSWSPDGSHILFRCGDLVCVVGLDGKRVGEWPIDSVGLGPVLQAAWSPDGTRIAVLGAFLGSRISDDPALQIMLFTMALDGTDPQFVLGQRTRGELEPVGIGRADIAADVGVCTEGVIVELPAENPGQVRDCEVLLRLRDKLAGTAVLDWVASRHITEWEGVWPRQRVNRLVLPDRRLSGTIPAELGSLPELTHIRLAGNDLHGSIPPELGQLRNLTQLDLRDNQLTGPIPAELGQLTNLDGLYLGGNQISGCIPPRRCTGFRTNDLASLGLPTCETAA